MIDVVEDKLLLYVVDGVWLLLEWSDLLLFLYLFVELGVWEDGKGKLYDFLL